MTSIESVTLEAPDPTAVSAFYTAAFGLGTQVSVRAAPSPRTPASPRTAPDRTGSSSAAMPGPSPTRTGSRGRPRESEAAGATQLHHSHHMGPPQEQPGPTTLAGRKRQ